MDTPEAKRQRVSHKVVLCFGDSNTYGASSEGDCPPPGRLPYEERWTSVLQAGLGSDYHVIPEGLNGRTTVVDDPFENPLFCGEGGQGMNGRRYLLPCLYSHRPIDLVVIGLGCNDLKTRFALGPNDIASGVMTLVSLVRESKAGPNDTAPKILVLSPPLCRETSVCLSWGFGGCENKSRDTIAAICDRCQADNVPCVALSAVVEVGTDGIHFNTEGSRKLGEHMVQRVKNLI
eukprot:TRINITY_DN42046_c0_g1_i1.p1 TRINITY_DN42046_c0_g1~~TRINITY_DN42046_c0_g1_i1.p1  ORF type:complete len:233 (-),score=23.29 TRINITY_DN42046_c0_g1_i1:283-981(-)